MKRIQEKWHRWLVAAFLCLSGSTLAYPQSTSPRSPQSGDPYTSPDSLMLGGQSSGQPGQMTIRGNPYGYYDTGTLLSVVTTNRAISGSRAGVNGGYERGVSAMAGDPDFDMVGFYNQVTNLPARLIITDASYDATHIFPHPALTQAQVAQLRRSMWVTTNSIDSKLPTKKEFGRLPLVNRYGTTVTGWALNGTVISVSGWTVPGSGNMTAGQVPSNILDLSQSSRPTAFIGTPTKVFAGNWILEYDPGFISHNGAQARMFEGLELDMWNHAKHDYEASFHGITIGYNSSEVGQDGHHIQPTSDSYDMRLAGNVPRGLVIDSAMGRLIDAGGFVLQPSVSPATSIGSTNVTIDLSSYIDSNRLRLLTYTTRDTAGGGWPSASVHFGLHVDGVTGTTGGSPMGDLVYNPPGKAGGIALHGMKGRGLTIDAEGNAEVDGRIRFATYHHDTLPSAGQAGTQVFCSDCLKPSEVAGRGTGMMIFDDGARWTSLAGTKVLN